jgi:uncharacterized membrane protein
MTRIASLLERLRLSLWFIPLLFAILAGVAAAISLTIDRELQGDRSTSFLFGGTAEGARSVLDAIAQSMLTFTALVFTITMLVLQLASSQLSPRVMRTFLRDRQNQVVLGLFVATFLFTLLVLRDVRSADADESFVPGFSIWIAFALLLTSVGAFVYYIDHMAHAIRASTVITRIAAETREAIDRLYPEDAADEEPAPGPASPANDSAQVITAERAGVLANVDTDAVVRAAEAADCFVEVVPTVGDFVPHGAPLFRVHDERRGRGRPGPAERDVSSGERRETSLEDRLRGTVSLEDERTLQQDVAFGLRQLVDVAARALSPGTNDPTTAVQAIDHLHDMLRRLAARPFPPTVHLGKDDRPRAHVPRAEWADYVRLALEEVRLYGEQHIQVLRRLRRAIVDLVTVCRPERQAPLREQLALLDVAVERAFADAADRRSARAGTDPDATGERGSR